MNKSVTLLGASSSVSITPTSGIGITVTANNVLLQTLRVTHSLSIGVSASNVSNLSLVNVSCDSNKTHGLSIGSGCSNVTINGGTFNYNGTSRGEGDGAGINVYASGGSLISNISIRGTLSASNNTTAGIWLDAASSADNINTVTIGANGGITLTNNGGAGVIVLGNVNGATITGNFTKGGALAAGIVIVGLDFSGDSSPINTIVKKSTFNIGYADTVPAISLSTGGYPYSYVNYISIKPVTADSNTFVGATSDSAIENVVWDYNDDKIDGLGLVTLTNNNPLVLHASATSLAFSNRAKSDSATLTAYLRNASTSTMTISSITTSTATFSATSGSTTIAGGDSTVLTVKFKPTSFGTFIDTVKVVSDGGTVKVALSGSSPIPTFTSLKASIAYGNIAKRYR